MADEVVRLKVDVQGDDAALQRLQSLDNLIDQLNKKTVKINVDREGLSSISQSASDLKSLGRSLDDVAASAGKMGASASSMNQLTQSTAKAGSAASTAASGADKFNKSTKEMGKQATAAGQSLKDMIGKFAGWYAVGELVSAPVAAFKDAVQELKNVDAELVNVQKVMGATGAEMDSLADKAYQVGSDLGVAASDYLTSVNQWAQAGYGSLADDLGELSVMTQQVGDVDQATANQFLLSVDAAYQYQGSIESLTRVLDGANEISNQYATSVQKLAGGMGIVSSLAAQAGMDVAETAAAIGTITSVTQESGNSAARALRALILNIQGSTEIAIDEATGERWTEEEINATSQAIEGLNVATREYKNGVEQLRNPMEVIGELSEKYRQGLISEVQLQEVVSTLGGKTRSNQLQALISNFDMYEDMVETFTNSAGSADREIEYYLDSWEAKANRLKNSWVQLVEGIQTSEISKGLLDVANGLLQIANTDIGQTVIQVGLLTTALTTATLAYQAYAKAAAAANSAEALKNLKGLPSIIAKVVSAANGIGPAFQKAGKQISYAFRALTSGRGLSTALALLGRAPLALTAVAAGVSLLTVGAIKLYDYLNVTAEEQKEAAAAANEEFQTSQTDLKNLNTELANTNSKIDELKSKGKLSLTDQRDLANLEEQNRVLEARIKIEERARELAEQTAVTETQAAIDKGYSQKWKDFMGNSSASWFETNASFAEMGFEEQINRLGEVLRGAQEARDELIDEIGDGEATKKQADLLESYEATISGATEGLTGISQELQEHYDGLAGATTEEGMALSEHIADLMVQTATAIDPVGATIDQIDSALNELSTDEIDNLNKALRQLQEDGDLTAQEIENLAEKLPVLQQLMDENGISAQQLADYFLESGDAANRICSDIERLKEILNPGSGLVNNALTAIEEFEKIAGKTDFDDIYDKYASAVKSFFDDYNEGIKNSQTLWAAADVFFTPEQLESLDWDIDSIAQKMAEIAELFNGDPNNFLGQLKELSDAGELVDEFGDNLIELNETGFDIPIENIDRVAEKFGVTEEAFVAMLKYAGMFNEEIADIDLSGIEGYVKDMGLIAEVGEKQVINADELKKQLQEAGASGKDIADAFEMLEKKGYNLVSVTEQVENLKDMFLELGVAERQGQNIQINISNYSQLMSQLGYTKEQAAELLTNLYNAGNVSFVDTEGNTISLQQAIDQVTTDGLKEEFNDLAGTAASAASRIKSEFQAAVNYVNELTLSPKVDIPDVTIPVNFDYGNAPDGDGNARATGTNFGGGPTLLGDEQGVGPKPELVIEGEHAFLAGQNGPEVRNLKPGARVLSNKDTRRALNGIKFAGEIPAMAWGSDWHVDYKGETTDLTGGYGGRPSGGNSSSSGRVQNVVTVTVAQSSDDGESYWEKQRKSLDEYLDALDKATELIEREQEGSYNQQIAYARQAQAKIHATANDFRAKGLKDTSQEIVELKLLWNDYADSIKEVYEQMYDDLDAMHADDEWELERRKKSKTWLNRSAVEIAADNQGIIAMYKRMQDEVHDLAEYYRAQGYDETDDLIQDLSDKWWEYEEEINSVYENLTDALENYIDKSEQKLEELERSGASVGDRMAVYIERITKAQQTLAALQFSNIGGRNDEAIADVKDQIWSDQDAIADIQEDLWDELDEAIQSIFEDKQKVIDQIDKEIDQANDRIEAYEDSLDNVLNDPSITGTDVGIIDLLERLSDQLDAEKDALESIVEPLENQIEGYYRRDDEGNLEYIAGIRDAIEGYYKRDDEGNLVYVEGLQDLLDKENERYEQEKKEHDEQIALEKKQLAVQEAIKNLQEALYDLQVAREERPLYTLKDGVWAWRPDEEAIKNAEDAVDDAEQAKEDAENDLKEYEEDQKHQQIIDSLQDQIDALEKQEEEINKQIDLYQKESKARQDYINDQIEYWEKEKEAYEDYYDSLIEVQEDIIKAKEDERDALREDLEKWEEEWEEITDSLKEPVRDIKDILNDIAKYGTPAMQDAVWNIVDLLEELGRGLEDFNPEFGGDNDWGNGDGYMDDFRNEILSKMKENSVKWHIADEQGKEQIHREQQELGASIGAVYSGDDWSWYDQDGNLLYNMDDPEIAEIVKDLMRQNAEAWHNASGSEKDKLFEQNQILGDLIGGHYHGGYWYDDDGNPLFDSGGIAHGLGVMQKATPADEVVLSPALSNLVLTPEKNREFAQFAQSMGLIFGAAHSFANTFFTREGVASSTTDSHNITINNVTIGENMLQRPLSDTLSLLGLHTNEW